MRFRAMQCGELPRNVPSQPGSGEMAQLFDSCHVRAHEAVHSISVLVVHGFAHLCTFFTGGPSYPGEGSTSCVARARRLTRLPGRAKFEDALVLVTSHG